MGSQNVAIVAIIFGTMGWVLFPLARALAKRMEGSGNPSPALPRDVSDRLDRIEHAVEAVAVEVERIAEGQRFVTKVMAERSEQSRLPPTQR